MVQKQKDYTTKILLGVIILILVIFGIYFIMNKNNPSTENTLDSQDGKNISNNSSRDFQILFIRWDDYPAEYNAQTDKREYTNQKIDWDNLCSLNEKTSYYSIQTNQTGIFGCEYSINGETQYYENYLGNIQRDLISFEDDGISTPKGVFQPMSPHIKNEFTFCCDKYIKIWEGTPYGDSGYEVEKTGEIICDSITLSAKCS